MTTVMIHNEIPIPVDDTHYIDVMTIDGVTYTYLMHKVAEPNEFAILKQEQGNSVDTIANDLGVA